jgi:hypothetical protein
MGGLTPMMPPPTWAALERLLEVARADTRIHSIARDIKERTSKP